MAVATGGILRACPGCAAKNRLVPERLHERAQCGRCHADVSPLAEPLPVRSVAEFDDLVARASIPVLVDFWAGWCGPCLMMAPELDRFAAMRRGDLLVAKVDTGVVPALAERYGVRSIPTLVLFRDGREARRATGAMHAEGIAAAMGV